MTTDATDTPRDDTNAMRDALMRRIAETRAIDTRAALAGIRSRRGIIRNHNHSVRHRAYR